jgi:hypothetical protein
MQQVTLTFERIFDIYRHPDMGKFPKHTTFGFTSNKITQYGVTVPGWPSIEPGTTVTALLKTADNWQTLLGWVNHTNGEIAAYEPGSTLIAAIAGGSMSLISIPVFFGAGSIATGSGRAFGGCMTIAFAVLAILGIMQWHKRKNIIRALIRLTPNSTGTPYA